MRTRASMTVRRLSVVAMLIGLGACSSPYDQVATCADMTTAVWPWRPVAAPQVTRVPPVEPVTSPYPAHAVQLTDPAETGGSPAAGSPVFECRYQGPFLVRAGWTRDPLPAR
ncbi:hypothetical protein [Arenibaculum pallidiluteum]|uniref:hypothetical protein n=1 Tax=Arenibaculum pallidiluteum TaxID=2812559 RepID=UPI001A96B9E1|nr:hypothetical protein [Arenibaculum pallidiluteum]